MTDRTSGRALMASAALLYLGPMLAGLSGFGWRAVPVFLLIFLLWDFVTRPQAWPGRAAGMTGASVPLLAVRAAVLAVIILLLFAVARGIGGLLGTITAMPLGLPVLVSLAAVPVARLFWTPPPAQPPARTPARTPAQQSAAVSPGPKPQDDRPAAAGDPRDHTDAG